MFKFPKLNSIFLVFPCKCLADPTIDYETFLQGDIEYLKKDIGMYRGPVTVQVKDMLVIELDPAQSRLGYLISLVDKEEDGFCFTEVASILESFTGNRKWDVFEVAELYCSSQTAYVKLEFC